ncbi:hypothetical protein PRIPAC_72597 [Pristionchus pacificus]|uniref:Uncharacterized protein n=1 Tax=Pristionchus pacificus TaxID=54126 RepID=A0A2A6C7W5_PRIPA|nr:hypothetical protein PRIPAC_72597 [Pristionchus pacificus]|eukprot:PDM74197.1 hypothetical protein PRIPAC_41553 [Pristionchus pacificus]
MESAVGYRNCKYGVLGRELEARTGVKYEKKHDKTEPRDGGNNRDMIGEEKKVSHGESRG